MKAKILVALTLLSASVPALAATDVQVTTNLGQFIIQLNDAKAPITTKNFLRYVDNGSYVDSIFHRVIPGFMAQGGGFNTKMQRLPTFAPIKNESNNGLKNLTATIAMARTSNPDSATRQFFINYKDNSFLDGSQNKPGYAVFGKVISGFDVVQKMTSIPTESLANGMQNVPQTPIMITAMKVIPSKDVSTTNTTSSTAQ
jgi:peptidyl-prolyl cis-trans isomerase A (cyclophilin A)